MAPVDLNTVRNERYWRVASPAQRVMYSWLTGEEPPAPGRERQRRRPHRKTAAARKPAVKRAA